MNANSDIEKVAIGLLRHHRGELVDPELRNWAERLIADQACADLPGLANYPDSQSRYDYERESNLKLQAYNRSIARAIWYLGSALANYRSGFSSSSNLADAIIDFHADALNAQAILGSH